MKISLNWEKTGMQFRGTDEKGNETTIDGNAKIAPSPMTMLLFATAGCTGSDVVSLLEKMREPLEELSFEVTGDKPAEGDYPRVWETIHIVYKLKGKLDPEKVNKAVSLSMEKYCSVSAMLKKSAKVTWEVQINP
jgi:putative redox protein